MSTISDVARQAGVSVGTVSRVINDVSNVAPEIRERVEKAISDLGYVPNVFARSLRSRKASSISVIVPAITNGHWRDLVRGAEDAAHSRGYVVLLCNTYDNPIKQRRYLEIAASQNVAGVVIAPYDSVLEDLSPLLERNVATVLVNRKVEGWTGDGVYSDNISGARALTRHLIQVGHRRIALISGRQRISTVVERIQGYCMALDEAGIAVDLRLIKSEVRRPYAGERLIEEILDEFERDAVFPDAIFVWNNMLGPGILQVLNRRGLHVPQDIGLACFGDSADMYFPFLTCIQEPAYEIGMNAVQLLLDRLGNGAEAPQRELVMPTRLIIRYSCGNQLSKESPPGTSLVIPPDLPERAELVQTVTTEEKQQHAESWKRVIDQADPLYTNSMTWTKPDARRIADAFHFISTGRLPYFEFTLPNQRIIDAVLQRTAEVNPLREDNQLLPEEHVELAFKLGMDAVVCDCSWTPPFGSVLSWADLDRLEAPVSSADWVTRLDRYLQAAAIHRMGVGVCVNSPELALGVVDYEKVMAKPTLASRLLGTVMDILLEHQQHVLRLICDRFSDRLAFIVIRDTIPGGGRDAEITAKLETGVLSRLERLITPARDQHLPVILSTHWSRAKWTPELVKSGIQGVFFEDAPYQEIGKWWKEWYGALVLIGSIPDKFMNSGSQDESLAAVGQYVSQLGSKGGYIFALSDEALSRVSPERYLEIIHQVCLPKDSASAG